MNPLAWLAPSAKRIDFWGIYSRVYDALRELASYREMLDEVVVAAELCRGARLVDLGCGTGNLAAQLLDSEPASLVCVDSSPEMTSRARDKLASANVEVITDTNEAYLVRAPRHSADRLFAVNVLYTLQDRRTVWRLVHEVLKPGGMLVVAHCDRSGFWPVVKHQVKHGWWTLLRPRLLLIGILQVVIEARAVSGRYEHASFAALAREAAETGLAPTFRGRTYGTKPDGLAFVATFQRAG